MTFFNRLKVLNRLSWHKVSITICVFFLIFTFTGLTQNPEKNEENPLYTDPSGHDFSQNPELLNRILSSPHGYFRFINIPFSQTICTRFQYTYSGTPSFNLHGDAHIEQYAVTDLGRGLTDFDDSSAGPAIIDLMRFGVSLYLTCMANDWEDNAYDLFSEFLKGYRMALEDPNAEAPEPTVSKRFRSKFKHDDKAYYEWVNSMMQPIEETERDSLISAMKSYIQTMYSESSELPSDYFDVVDMGYLKMGIGSALDLKYLLRCQGKTDDPFDDVVLEIKEVRDISGISCLTRAQKFDPFRILIGQSRIAYQPFHHLGYFTFRGINLWVHSWVQNYKEVDIYKSFKNVNELKEVVFDIGVQLGRGHPKQIAAPLDLQLRLAQLRWLNLYDVKLNRSCNKLADEVVKAWNLFRTKVKNAEQK